MHVKILLWSGFVIWLYTKQTEDGSQAEKPLAASAMGQYQKPNEDMKLHQRKDHSQIVLLRTSHIAHTLYWIRS